MCLATVIEKTAINTTSAIEEKVPNKILYLPTSKITIFER